MEEKCKEGHLGESFLPMSGLNRCLWDNSNCSHTSLSNSWIIFLPHVEVGRKNLETAFSLHSVFLKTSPVLHPSPKELLLSGNISHYFRAHATSTVHSTHCFPPDASLLDHYTWILLSLHGLEANDTSEQITMGTVVQFQTACFPQKDKLRPTSEWLTVFAGFLTFFFFNILTVTNSSKTQRVWAYNRINNNYPSPSGFFPSVFVFANQADQIKIPQTQNRLSLKLKFKNAWSISNEKTKHWRCSEKLIIDQSGLPEFPSAQNVQQWAVCVQSVLMLTHNWYCLCVQGTDQR